MAVIIFGWEVESLVGVKIYDGGEKLREMGIELYGTVFHVMLWVINSAVEFLLAGDFLLERELIVTGVTGDIVVLFYLLVEVVCVGGIIDMGVGGSDE